MERKIGEIFEYNSEWYQCVKKSSCGECDFLKSICINNPSIKCSAEDRNDNCSVVFKKLEKVGEPIEYNGSFHQGYKAIDTAIDVCKFCVFSEISCGDAVICDKGVFYIKIKQSQENMEEKKLNLKPFDIQKAREGKPVCTRDGRKARIICFDRDWDMHIVALVSDPLGESVHYYLSNGKVDFYKQNDEDLMMLPEKKEGWVNIYCSQIYNTLEKAKEAYKITGNDDNYLQTIKISWEE